MYIPRPGQVLNMGNASLLNGGRLLLVFPIDIRFNRPKSRIARNSAQRRHFECTQQKSRNSENNKCAMTKLIKPQRARSRQSLPCKGKRGTDLKSGGDAESACRQSAGWRAWQLKSLAVDWRRGFTGEDQERKEMNYCARFRPTNSSTVKWSANR